MLSMVCLISGGVPIWVKSKQVVLVVAPRLWLSTLIPVPEAIGSKQLNARRVAYPVDQFNHGSCVDGR